jgi:very-short-patch-repair endonuclease
VNRQTRSEQHFDSKFEQNVYDFLFSKLDPIKYTLTTQVESCGFKIDLVIRSIETGKKLAIECDGPTHFEAGDGQVRVSNDYERQFVLETAGWRFYRIIYSEWLEEESTQKVELIDYIKKYMKQAQSISEDNRITNEPTYVPVTVEVPKEFVEALKASAAAQPASRFGRKKAEIKDKTTSQPPSKTAEPQLELTYDPIQSTDVKSVKSAPKPTSSRDIRPQKPKISSTFSVGDREVNQKELEKYLKQHVKGTIQVRYQSMRVGSARYWRSLNLIGFDGTYIQAKQDDREYPVKYRRDRVVEYR